MSENIIKDVWVKKSLLRSMHNSSFKEVRSNVLYDAYNIWNEAYKTIEESDDNKEKLNQGFLSLKRAYNVASKELKKSTGIDEIKYTGKGKRDFYKDLEHFEIIKTSSIQKYVDIRNMIEHENSSPPSKDECMIFSEYIWSYIRSVSNILDRFTDTIYLDCNEAKIYFTYNIEEKNGQKRKNNDKTEKIYIPSLKVDMCVNRKYISFLKRDDSFAINNIEIMGRLSSDNIDTYRFDCYRDSLQYFICSGEIKDQDKIVMYFKHMMLPEYEDLNGETIYEIFK